MTKLDTVIEISNFLGVKPARAYELARLWELSGGKAGLPCIRLGKRQLRFSRVAVESFVNKSGSQGEKGREVLANE